MVKLIIYTPAEAEQRILRLMLDSGVGAVGAYRGWSICGPVTERFEALEAARPYQGRVGELTEVQSIRLEFQVPQQDYPALVNQIKAIHPYETPAIEVIPLLYPEG